MRIGIIVYSNTGHTLSAAEELKKELSKRGHSVSIDRIETTGDPMKKVEISRSPRTDGYDGIVFGSPVWGFRLSQVTGEYMKGMGALDGKPTVVFVTKELTPRWMGGSGAVRTMKKHVQGKGGKVVGSGIIVWKKKTGPSKDMPSTVKGIADLF